MAENRIREFRKQRGMTLEALAEKVGLHHSHLSRLEKGDRLLMIPVAEKIAKEVGRTPQEVMGYARSTPLPGLTNNGNGFSEETAPYTLQKGDPLIALQGERSYPFKVLTHTLSKAGILYGDIVFVSDEVGLCNSPPPLAAVRARFHPPDDFMNPVTLLRQFVPPRLLITNAMNGNNMPIDMDEADAHIVGVVTSVHRRAGA